MLRVQWAWAAALSATSPSPVRSGDEGGQGVGQNGLQTLREQGHRALGRSRGVRLGHGGTLGGGAPRRVSGSFPQLPEVDQSPLEGCLKSPHVPGAQAPAGVPPATFLTPRMHLFLPLSIQLSCCWATPALVAAAARVGDYTAEQRTGPEASSPR